MTVSIPSEEYIQSVILPYDDVLQISLNYSAEGAHSVLVVHKSVDLILDHNLYFATPRGLTASQIFTALGTMAAELESEIEHYAVNLYWRGQAGVDLGIAFYSAI